MAYYYTTDGMSREGFKPGGKYEVGRANPIREALQKENLGLEDHVYEYVNKWKVADIVFGAKADGKNWRSFGDGIFKTSVDERVFLYVEDMSSLQFDYKNEYEKVEDLIKSKAGFLNKASQAIEFARLISNEFNAQNPVAGGKFVSAYSTLKAWKSTSGLKGMSELTFKFRFGQAGLFDALEEVVKPVLALGSAFAPSFVTESYMKGPLPTVAEYLVKIGSQFISSIIKDLDETASKGLEKLTSSLTIGGSGAETEKPPDPPETGLSLFNTGLQKLTAFQANLYKGIDSAIGSVMSESGSSMMVFTLKIGRLVAGRFTAEGAKMKFDMTQVDERGYPFQGSVTISGMETFMVADRTSILKLFGGDGSSTSTDDAYVDPNAVEEPPKSTP